MPAWLEVIRVLPNSPAARAGVRPRDAITAINGKPLRFRDDHEVLQFFAALRAGDRVAVHIRRGTAALDVTITAAKAPPGAEQRWQDNRDFANGKH
jgi:S1-C subfamily serine protease